MGTPLIDIIQGFEGFVVHTEKVCDYVMGDGEWNRDKLAMWFHPHEIDRIVSAYPPVRREERTNSFGNHPLMVVFLLNLHIVFYLQVQRGARRISGGAYGAGPYQRR